MHTLGCSNSWVPPGEELVDPITQELMTDPVVAADGHTYDRSSIEHHFSNASSHHRVRSPMTNQVLPNLNLIPNHAIRGLIREYHNQNPNARDSTQQDGTEASERGGFQVFIRNLEGKTRVINNVKSLLTIKQLKLKVQDVLGVPIEEQRLIYGGKQLEDDVRDGPGENTVETYGIREHSTIHLALRLRGGAE